MLQEKTDALSRQKEELELEKRCTEATLDRTERAWHATLSREAELLQVYNRSTPNCNNLVGYVQEAARLKAVCHAQQEQCRQDVLLAEAKVVASQVN